MGGYPADSALFSVRNLGRDRRVGFECGMGGTAQDCSSVGPANMALLLELFQVAPYRRRRGPERVGQFLDGSCATLQKEFKHQPAALLWNKVGMFHHMMLARLGRPIVMIVDSSRAPSLMQEFP